MSLVESSPNSTTRCLKSWMRALSHDTNTGVKSLAAFSKANLSQHLQLSKISSRVPDLALSVNFDRTVCEQATGAAS
jgi:hypothetical protein